MNNEDLTLQDLRHILRDRTMTADKLAEEIKKLWAEAECETLAKRLIT